MRILLMVTAIAGAAPATIAQPQHQGPQASASAPAAPPVVLASANDVKQPGAADHAPRARRPAPRVTKCRCGDPQGSVEQPVEDQPDQ